MRKELLMLFVGALAARVFASLLQVLIGTGWLYSVLPGAVFNDFYVNYAQWFALLGHGLLPYRDFYTYTYPPLFLYTLYPFYLVGGLHVASVPAILSDAGTAVMVYLIAQRLTNPRAALLAGTLYSLCPIALLYEGFFWLSSQPMTFFLMLSIYWMLAGRSTVSFASYGISVMFKQEAIFAFPVFVVWQIARYRRGVWKGIGVFAAVVAVVSLPFLLTAGSQYLASLGYQFLGGLTQAAAGPASSVGGAVGQSQSSLIVLKPCPPILPTGGAPFACIRYPNPMLTALLTSIDWMSNALALPFLALVGSSFILMRRSGARLELLVSFSLLCFLALFSFIVHQLAAYYFLPVYALLFSSSRSRVAASASLVASTASIVLPTGNFPLVMGLVAILTALIAGSVVTRQEPDEFAPAHSP